MAASKLSCGAASVSEVARAARDSRSSLRDPRLAAGLSPRALRLGQSLCQWLPLHQRHGAHLLLQHSSGSGRGRFGSAAFSRLESPRTVKACAAPGLASSSRRTFLASAALKTLRAAPMVRAKLPTPEFRESTSSNVEMLSLRRPTAFATFSDSTASGS
eukprot:1412078-Pleurochrysis_carterae.AAC.2